MASKLDQIHLTVGAQLRIESKPVNDTTRVIGRDLQYDFYTVQLFLVAIERTLFEGNPSHKFTWDDDFAAATLKMTISELIGAIDARTV